ncbi:uncharacterized protein LOC125956524 isoform X5 [Anopheles darlingi]|uniref:uncharacterized protein LOC125956524 isoform X5 n=1 Tax=Anopheles darlingi TaxID=43151 RepID=UPI00210033CC|nr:uncharacterized protein LOC125956524 isoform X5 [Anopheles darlingi]
MMQAPVLHRVYLCLTSSPSCACAVFRVARTGYEILPISFEWQAGMPCIRNFEYCTENGGMCRITNEDRCVTSEESDRSVIWKVPAVGSGCRS